MHLALTQWFRTAEAPSTSPGAGNARGAAGRRPVSSFGKTAGWLSGENPSGLVGKSEAAALSFAFRARLAVTLIVTAWLLIDLDAAKTVYALGLSVALMAFGYLPYRLRRHPAARILGFAFVVADVVLLTAVTLAPLPGAPVECPVQARLHGVTFLLPLLLLAEAALTYSSARVFWTGAWIVIAWSTGFKLIYDLPSTIRCVHVTGTGPNLPSSLAQLTLAPNFVSVHTLSPQVTTTALLTLVLGLAVLRSRMHLVAEDASEKAKSDLARYLSPDVAGAVVEQATSGFGRPETREVSVLFADIVGFTGLAKRLSPESTFDLLTRFRERVTNVVVRHRGTLEKFIGDGLMATFGALQVEHDAADRAISCAFELRHEVERWNSERRDEEPIRLSISLHHGPVVVGVLGSEERVEFTVVGDRGRTRAPHSLQTRSRPVMREQPRGPTQQAAAKNRRIVTRRSTQPSPKTTIDPANAPNTAIAVTTCPAVPFEIPRPMDMGVIKLAAEILP